MSPSSEEEGSANPSGWGREASPYHPGEIAVQERAGARAFAERIGRQVIREYMTDQHRVFFAMLPYLFIGALDSLGRPWASALFGSPGFALSPTPRRLTVAALPSVGDPARFGINLGAPIAFVGVEFATRRRNRLTGKIVELGESSFGVAVDQSFGNCPQYIQARAPQGPRSKSATPRAQALGHTLDAVAESIVRRADTIFIASASPKAGSADPVEGVDVNHRGGRPGFVRVETTNGRSVLTIPDFVGNLAFNTLGNISLNPRAGILAPDFATGDVVTMTGKAEVIWDGSELKDFAGAERLLRFEVQEAYLLPNLLPWRWSAPEVASQLPATGDWETVKSASLTRAQARLDRPFRVIGIRDESPTVRSFWLQPVEGGIAGYEPGQYLPISLKVGDSERHSRRTYTLSQAPGEAHYQISVRRGQGAVSAWLHDHVVVGDEILAQAPRGNFQLDSASTRSALLIGGGIGITPLLAMAEFLTGGTESRLRFPGRAVRLIHAVHDGADHPFRNRVEELERTRTNFSAAFVYSAPRDVDREGVDFRMAGRLDRAALRTLLPLNDYDCYLCGPAGFMQTVYDALRSLSIPDEQIRAETFGPSSLKRSASPPSKVADPAPALQPLVGAKVAFEASAKEREWTGEGAVLDLAEAAGLVAPWSCRSGRCGTCLTKVVSGRVSYAAPPEFEAPPGSALICVALPADPELVIDL